MIPFCLALIFLIIMQLFCINACVKIMRNKSIIASNRWMASLIVFLFPIVGVIFFKTIESSVRHKEYVFFTEEFIDNFLYKK